MTTNRTRIQAAAAAIALLTGVAVATASPAVADRAPRDRHRYLALGDSMAFGFDPSLEEPWEPDRFVGYPEVIGRLPSVAETNLACPGQTAQALVSLDAPDNGCFEFRRWAEEEGVDVLHADYEGTQLDAALAAVRSSRPPTLISVQGGGNDWSACALEDPDPELDPDECVDEVLPAVTASLRTVVSSLRGAGYRGRIVVAGYHLIPGFEPQLRRINRGIEQAARRSNVAFADVAVLFSGYAQHTDGDLCAAGLLIEVPDGSCDIHPTRTGQRLYALAVLMAA